MPTCRRKRVVLTEPPQALLDAGGKEASRQVYYLAQTGEIFQSYECAALLRPLRRLHHAHDAPPRP